MYIHFESKVWTHLKIHNHTGWFFIIFNSTTNLLLSPS